MTIQHCSTAILANIESQIKIHAKNYDLFKESHLFWAFIDLKESSNYRIIHGPQEGYIRSESFFSLIGQVIAPCDDVRKIKEIGDEVFLSSQCFRSILECVIMTWFLAQRLAISFNSKRHPFSVRAAIGFGPAKRLNRESDDFIGSPIDQLSRIMSVRIEGIDILINETTYRDNKATLDEYKNFLSVSDAKFLDATKSKEMSTNIFYREVLIDKEKLANHDKNFLPWAL